MTMNMHARCAHALPSPTGTYLLENGVPECDNLCITYTWKDRVQNMTISAWHTLEEENPDHDCFAWHKLAETKARTWHCLRYTYSKKQRPGNDKDFATHTDTIRHTRTRRRLHNTDSNKIRGADAKDITCVSVLITCCKKICRALSSADLLEQTYDACMIWTQNVINKYVA